MADAYLTGFLDGMQAAADALRRIQPTDAEPPAMIADYPTPAVVCHPERVGFYRLPDETD